MTADAQLESNGSGNRRTPTLHDWFQKSALVQRSSDDSFLNIQLNDDRKEVPTDDLGKKYDRPTAEYESLVWRLGWTDGRSGQPSVVNEMLLEAHARITCNARIGEAQEQVVKTEEAVSLAEEKLDDLDEQYETLEKRYQDIADERQEHFQDFSRKQAWTFLLFGTATLIADIPLSLRLVATGFGVKTSAEIDGQVVRVDDILSSYFFDVLSNFWEALALALGIAFSSILIKYFFDLVIFRQQNQPMPKVVKSLVWIGLVLFVSTTVCLGLFRYRIQPQVEAYERRERWESSRQRKIDQKYTELLSVFSHDEDPIGRARSEAERIVDTQIGKDQTPEFNSIWGLPTFILLTLLLPTVTAVCFSVAGRKFRKAYLYDSLSEERAKLLAEISNTAIYLSNVRGQLASFQTELEGSLKPEMQDDILQRYRYLYRHGYERGLKNVPPTIDRQVGSVYELSLQYLQRMLERRIRSIT
jgi:hypothetical protein